MSDQPDLFLPLTPEISVVIRPPVAVTDQPQMDRGTFEVRSHRDDPPASRIAAESAREYAASQRQAILAQLASAGERGFTAHELDLLFDWHTPSGSPAGRRLSELLRTKPPEVARLAEMREGCHVHVLSYFVNNRPTIQPRERPDASA